MHNALKVSICFFVSLVYLTLRTFAVILEHFDQVVGDCFMDCVNCLIRFANNKTSHRISLKAIALLRICEDRLAEVCIGLSSCSSFKIYSPYEYYTFVDHTLHNCFENTKIVIGTLKHFISALVA